MNLSELFIRRPVMTTLVMVALLLFGLLSYGKLPVAALPNVDFPTINVSAGLPGASPETMAASVATPLEREFSTIDGLDSMSSSSTLGNTQITLQFDLRRNLDAAAQDVQSAIARAGSRLPRNLPAPPSYRKVNPADTPILFIIVSSATVPLYTVNEYADTMLAQRISTVRGVAQVQVFGAQKYAVRIQLDPDAMASRGIGIDEVSNAVQAANVNMPTGTLYGPDKAFTIETNGQLTDAAAYRNVIVTWKDGTPVRVQDIGRVVDGVENDKVAAWFVDKRSVVLAVQKQPGANVVEVADGVRALLPTFRAELPAAVNLDLLFDRSESVRDSVNDVQFTLLLTLGLVVLVIFVFLRSIRATLIPSLAMPLSIVGTFAVIQALGFSLNNLTLMALTLSVGFVVDDAIVVLENIVRHIEMGKDRFQAALDGAKEISFTIVSMTLSLVVVFIPILFMGGILGRLFHEFAVTIAVSILISGIVALTLTPMLGARILKTHGVDQGRLYRATEFAFDGLLRVYDRSLRFVLRHKLSTLAFSGAVLVATVLLFGRIPKGFLPTEDTGQLSVQTEAIEGISFDSMVLHQQMAAAIVRANPNVDGFSSNLGRGGGASNSGSMFIRLKPRGERKDDAEQVANQLRPALAQIPGLRSFVQVPPSIRIGGRLTKSEYQITLQSADSAALYDAAPKLAEDMKKLPSIRDVTLDLLLKNPQLDVRIDRDRAASLGVSATDLDDALYSAYGSRQISSIYAATNTYQVILELDPDRQRDPSALDQIYVRSRANRLIPIRALAEVSESLGPLSVNHSGQLPAVTISFNMAPGYGLSQAVDSVQELARTTLPATVTTRFQGAAEAFQSSMAGLGMLLILAIAVIYMVLGILYESFIHPVTILSALPFAGFGALVTLYAFGKDLDVYAFVGVILLVGLVKKNGIMMVDFAIEARHRGLDSEAAIHEACLVRFRPIMMTTMAALLGTLPIAAGIGAGAESRQPLGLAVVGGLLFSQFLTLFVTPVFYVYLDRVQTRLSPKRAEVPVATPAE